MHELEFCITLQRAALFPELGGNPNLVRTLGYVPGAALWGAAGIAYLHARGIPFATAHQDPSFRKWRQFEREVLVEADGVGLNGCITLTLVSALIGRDEAGRPAARIPEAELRAALSAGGLTMTRIEPVAVRQVRIGGYNTKWNLPRPQDPALAAGSVFRVARRAVCFRRPGRNRTAQPRAAPRRGLRPLRHRLAYADHSLR